MIFNLAETSAGMTFNILCWIIFNLIELSIGWLLNLAELSTMGHHLSQNWSKSQYFIVNCTFINTATYLGIRYINPTTYDIIYTVSLINKLKFSRVLSSAHTRSDVQQHETQCTSTYISMYEYTRSIVQAHASLQHGVYRYASDWTNVSRALQAREWHTCKLGLVWHTREWQVLLFTHTCVAYRYHEPR